MHKILFTSPRRKPTMRVRFHGSRTYSLTPEKRNSAPAHRYEARHKQPVPNTIDCRHLYCPKCNRLNRLNHGDCIICGCDTIMQLHGNNYEWWDKETVHQEILDYSRISVDEFEPSIVDRLTTDKVIRDAAQENPAVLDAIEQVAAIIKLHTSS